MIIMIEKRGTAAYAGFGCNNFSINLHRLIEITKLHKYWVKAAEERELFAPVQHNANTQAMASD